MSDPDLIPKMLKTIRIQKERIEALEAALRQIRDLGRDEAQFTFRYIAQRAIEGQDERSGDRFT